MRVKNARGKNYEKRKLQNTLNSQKAHKTYDMLKCNI